MKELLRSSDVVTIQVVCDCLSERGISFRVDNSGMHGLLPLPSVMDLRVMVAAEDELPAKRVLADLEIAL